MSNQPRQHNAFVRWKHTTPGRLCWALLAAAIAYVFATLAIDSGALWQWGLAIIFVIDALYNLVQLIRNIVGHGSHRPDAA